MWQKFQTTHTGECQRFLRGSFSLLPIAAVFFRRSRLFFREAAFSSGGEGCEWRAQRATVGESGDKAENEFSGFIPLTVPRKGFSPHIPASRLFVHFHTTMPTTPTSHNSNIPKIATFPIGLAFRHRAQYLCPRVL